VVEAAEETKADSEAPAEEKKADTKTEKAEADKKEEKPAAKKKEDAEKAGEKKDDKKPAARKTQAAAGKKGDAKKADAKKSEPKKGPKEKPARKPREPKPETRVSDKGTTLALPLGVQRKWYVIDAAGKPLGRVATQAATLLRGKHKVIFTPNVDCGDHVIIVNCDKAVLTGKKLEKKFYRTDSGWVGGLKETRYSDLMARRSDFALMEAVRGMLPHNTLGARALKRLRTYKGEKHNNEAQNPQEYKF
jgi:large subunit ribosomal protein L13